MAGARHGLQNRCEHPSTTHQNNRQDIGLRQATDTPADALAPLLPTDNSKTDPDLAAVVDAWPTLPEALKAGILAMVKAAAVAKDWG